jgi:hypothetical protein
MSCWSRFVILDHEASWLAIPPMALRTNPSPALNGFWLRHSASCLVLWQFGDCAPCSNLSTFIGLAILKSAEYGPELQRAALLLINAETGSLGVMSGNPTYQDLAELPSSRSLIHELSARGQARIQRKPAPCGLQARCYPRMTARDFV